ncbi:MAG TPA: Ni/Fe hydrogenase subunit alpha [Burkholderiales bacterium]|nr:Ni/Fe hydrogenase subunit alpha [Burkholderiales bacterium]
MSKVQVDVHYITRVEGHGNIVVDAENGDLKRCELQIVETPRFFEAMLRGRPYTEVTHIVSRICGICSVGHQMTSLQALEAALGVTPSEQTQLLRKLIFHGEILDSHVLHSYMLVAPDFFGVGSVIPLAGSHPEVVLRALRMKKLAGDLCMALGGRHTHPVTLKVGGFSHLPTRGQLEQLRARFEEARADVDATVELFQPLKMPDFERETEYIALRKPAEYAFIGGTIASTDGVERPVADYREVTNEHLIPHSTAKHTRHKREAYMVGALARFNVNHDLLHPKAKAAAEALGLKPICTNPYMNTLAQVVEIAHCIEDGIQLIDTLLERGIQDEVPSVKVRAGKGAGACEVPRGVLFHEYTVGDDGRIVGANCIIPTGQNLANIEADMRALVPRILDRAQDQIRLTLEMLVRAYDPCISCSTHMLDVKFE